MIELLCPVCRALVKQNEKGLICPNQHQYERRNGVYRFMEATELARLDDFLTKFEAYRKDFPQRINKENINNLPYVDFDQSMWKLRQYDLELIQSHLPKNKKLKILDIGAWNGWLSHNLSKLGHEVVAFDYFKKELDGLESVQYYADQFIAIQGQINDLSIFQSKFDIIIINRCFQYINKLPNQIQQMKQLLNPNGKIIITGLSLTNRPNRVKKHLKESDIAFRKKYGISLYFIPIKGLVTEEDLLLLQTNCFSVRRYKKLKIKSLLAKIKLTEIDYKYAIFNS
jgi:2-polyprenyl-3-methyl-5-hydroxy-6-metoxy-1,4-benzoquinol methylase